ncbi:MAG: hypothetical protein U0Z70_10645 [Thermomicrobiales bacterium]|nr:hypothetical protein [Chloroflexia bacterium]
MSDPLRAATAHPSLVPVGRRRLLGAIAGGALLAGLQAPASLAQPATTTANPLTQLTSLSKSLCGGGIFDEARVAQLAALIASDPAIATGVEELLHGAAATPMPGSRSPAAQAAAQQILLYWYTGEFNGEPIANHAEVYTELQAWQAMYTSACTVCKVYGAWADPPTMMPQEPENA